MVKVEKQETRGGEFIKISTDNHWTDIINIHQYEEFGGKTKINLSYSSGGANSVPAIDLARSMVEAWKKHSIFLKRKKRRCQYECGRSTRITRNYA
jgi:hypothetical protein